MQEQEQLTIKFETESSDHSADALAVGITLEAFSTMVEEVHKKFGDNHKLLVKARPFSKGSFEIPLDIVFIAAVGAGLFKADYISHLLSIIKDYFSIKNQLKGEIPKIEDGKVIFNGNVINMDNITINLMDPSSHANQLVSKAISAISSDEKIKDMVITRETNKEEIARVPKQNFPYYNNIQTTFDTPENQIKQEKATLIIRSAVFEDDKEVKWKFLKNGEKISANILDESFLSKVKIGEKFAAGDSLEVNLQSKKKYDKMYDSYTNPKYTITTVYKHNRKPEQLELDI